MMQYLHNYLLIINKIPQYSPVSISVRRCFQKPFINDGDVSALQTADAHSSVPCLGRYDQLIQKNDTT